MGCGGAAAIFGASRFGAGGGFPLDGGAGACYASVHATSGAEEGSIKLV